MPYTFHNLTTRETITCPDEVWIRCLETARAGGWRGDGTRYDFEYQVDEIYDTMQDYLYNLWMICITTREMFEWNGNYVDKLNQVVSESDAYDLKLALEKSLKTEERGLFDFLGNGPFRICAE